MAIPIGNSGGYLPIGESFPENVIPIGFGKVIDDNGLTIQYGKSPLIDYYNYCRMYMEVYEMQVYDVIAVDTKRCEILYRQEVVAEDEKGAILELNVTENIKKAHKKGEVKFIFHQLGGFDRYKE